MHPAKCNARNIQHLLILRHLFIFKYHFIPRNSSMITCEVYLRITWMSHFTKTLPFPSVKVRSSKLHRKSWPVQNIKSILICNPLLHSPFKFL